MEALGDLAGDLCCDSFASGGLLQSRRVEVGDVVEPVFPAYVLTRSFTQALPERYVRAEPVEDCSEHVDFPTVNGHLGRDIVGQLCEPAVVTDNEWLSGRERSYGDARRLT